MCIILLLLCINNSKRWKKKPCKFYFLHGASIKIPTKNNEIFKNHNNKQRKNEVINPKQKNSWKTFERNSSKNTKK